MHLITMAHLGEAQGVIQSFELIRRSQDLFEGKELTLLLTGEGPFEAATKTALHLGQKTYTSIINLGIAGSLKNLKVGDLHEVRTHYLVIEGKPQFKSFTTSKTGLDCLTTFERILSLEKAQALRGLGTLVDREGWGVAYAAKLAGIPYQSFKVISDLAGSLGACELVKDEAFHFSLILAEKLQAILNQNTEKRPSFVPEGFHFTFTTHHQFLSLLNKLSLKNDQTPQETLKVLPLTELLTNISLPKERTKNLIRWMEQQLDPVKHHIHQKIETWQRPYKQTGIDLNTDPHWEDEKVRISFEIKTDEELQEKLEKLKGLSLLPYQQILAGKFHVE